MSAQPSPAGSIRRHGRNISRTIPVRSAVDPLDMSDDPLAEKSVTPATSEQSDAAASIHSLNQRSSLAQEPSAIEKPTVTINLKFLQDRDDYHRIPTDDIPEVILSSSNQPEPDAPLTELLRNGHFRRAAAAAVHELLQCRPEDASHILPLLYVRLACLVLISRPDLAAQEAASLTDYLARYPLGVEGIIPLIPWELRLLLVRLISITASDAGRRGVMALYSLASEARTHVKEGHESGDRAAVTIWSERLEDLGLRVADALVEMGELETAARHLDTLTYASADEIKFRKALLRLRVGDVEGADTVIDKIEDARRKASLISVLDIAKGDYTAAKKLIDAERSRQPEGAQFASNLAVSLLYTGHISRAREILEELAETQSTFPGMLFNLSTIYELCADTNGEKKSTLASRIATKAPTADSGGWERANFEFKL